MKISKNIPKPMTERQQALLNVQQVLIDLQNNDIKLLEKISKFADRYGISFDAVKSDLMTGNFIALERFAVSPKRQGRSEQIVEYALDQDLDILDFTKLPKRGKNALYFNNGIVGNIKHSTAHSLDFVILTTNFTLYASAKQTSEEGGSQNQQFLELKHFALETLTHITDNIKYGAIVEGKYYNDKRLRELAKLNKDFIIWRILDDYSMESVSI